MVRSRWRPTLNDLGEYNKAAFLANHEIYKATRALTEDVGLDKETVMMLLPYSGLGISGLTGDDIGELRDLFYNRADFNRELSRLRGIIRAGESAPRKTGVVSIAPDTANQLTSFYLDEDGNILESQYMRREWNRLRSQSNKRRMKVLQEYGVEFEKVKLLDENLKPIYDENRHPITQWMPKTPGMLARYKEKIQESPDLVIEDDVVRGAKIDMWGDIVPASSRDYVPRPTPERMYRETQVDKIRAESVTRYFDNYKMLIDTTMPKSISDEIDEYIDEMKSQSIDIASDVYDLIAASEDVAGTIEYFYWDTAGSLPSKMATIINFWRTEIAPMLGIFDRDPIDVTEVSTFLKEEGYAENGLYPIFGEFQKRRSDKPKGKWRQDIWRKAHGDAE